MQDLRYAWRSLRRTPGFTLAAVLTLMLGIGTNTAIFSVINAVMVQPLPYPEPDRLMAITRTWRDGSEQLLTGLTLRFLQEHVRGFESVAARRYSASGAGIATATQAESVASAGVSADYFRVLGIEPMLGRGFTADEDRPAGPPVVVLGHDLWRRLFNADPTAVGRSVLLGGRAHTIVGVAAPGFTVFPSADVWIPLRAEPGTTDLETVGRLRHGVTPAQAAGELEALSVTLGQTLPPGFEARGRFTMEPLHRTMVKWVRPALLVLWCAVGLVLLIACANIASLLLVRATGRRREVATRAALGASRGRIVRQLLTESVLLALVGGALGIAMAFLALQSLLALVPADVTTQWREIALDRTVLLVALAISVATGMVFGIVPALDMARLDVRAALADGDGRSTGGRRVTWFRHALVVSQVALCVTLLVGAGLLGRTFVNLLHVPSGVDVRRVMTAQMSLREVTDVARIGAMYERTLARIRTLPGVEAAAVMSDLPLTRGLRLPVRVLGGQAAADTTVIDWRYVTPDFLPVFRVPVVAGRAFSEADGAGAAPVALVNQTLARRYFGTASPVGRYLQIGVGKTPDPPVQVVGVIADIRSSLRGDVRPTMYVPVGQVGGWLLTVAHGYFPVSWVVRTRDDRAAAHAHAIREAVRAVEPQLPLSRVQSMEDVAASAVGESRSQMVLLAIFAGIALMLAAAGLYGLVASTVAQRTREIGIHMALGATAGRIIRQVVARGLMLTLAGLTVGLGVATVASRWLESFLFGVSTRDPLTFAGAAAFLVAIAVAASLLPAMRAARIDPMRTLRSE